MDLKGKVVFSSGISLNFDIWCLNFESRCLSQLTTGDNLNDFPRWSPDGSRVAYISTQEDSVPSLWVMAADGQEKRQLTKDIYCQAPSWSPDGKQLIFAGNGLDANEIEVCSINFDGTSLSKLFVYQGVEQTPSFSPDGKFILFSAPALKDDISISRGDTDIIEYNISDGSFQKLCSHPARDYAPVYSPDGMRIAFVSHRNDKLPSDYHSAYAEFRDIIVHGSNAEGRAAMMRMKNFELDGDIFVMNRDGSGLTQLTDDSLADDGVCWSPCGSYLMYSSASMKEHQTERLRIIDSRSGDRITFNYDRTAFEQEIGSLRLLNAGFFQRIVPDFIEKLSVEASFWGEERRPHWTR